MAAISTLLLTVADKFFRQARRLLKEFQDQLEGLGLLFDAIVEILERVQRRCAANLDNGTRYHHKLTARLLQ